MINLTNKQYPHNKIKMQFMFFHITKGRKHSPPPNPPHDSMDVTVLPSDLAEMRLYYSNEKFALSIDCLVQSRHRNLLFQKHFYAMTHTSTGGTLPTYP